MRTRGLSILFAIAFLLVFGKYKAKGHEAPSYKERFVQLKEKDVLFGFNKTRPDSRYKRSLNEFARQVIGKPKLYISVTAHTDNVGSPDINLKISRLRAMAIAKYLMDKGVPEHQIHLNWMGEDDPIVSNFSDESRKKNRRATIRVIERVKQEEKAPFNLQFKELKMPVVEKAPAPAPIQTEKKIEEEVQPVPQLSKEEIKTPAKEAPIFTKKEVVSPSQSIEVKKEEKEIVELDFIQKSNIESIEPVISEPELEIVENESSDKTPTEFKQREATPDMEFMASSQPDLLPDEMNFSAENRIFPVALNSLYDVQEEEPVVEEELADMEEQPVLDEPTPEPEVEEKREAAPLNEITVEKKAFPEKPETFKNNENETVLEKKVKASLDNGILFVDKETGTPIQVTIEIPTERGNQPLKSDENGWIEIPKDEITEGKINIYAPGYFYQSVDSGMDLNGVEISMTPLRPGQTIHLKELKFQNGSAKILPASLLELKKLKKALDENPDVRIEVGGHINVPFISPRELNKDQWELSKNRAKAVSDYLEQHGIDKSRLKYKGYGNSKMIYPRPKTSEERAMNRRVEIVILE